MIPNLISLSRLVMAVAFVRYASDPVVAVAILCAAGVSDWLDGWAAKRLGQETRFGAVLDPACDRVFIVTVLVTLTFVHDIPVWILGVLLARDVVNSIGAAAIWALRPEWVGFLRARFAGKVVTTLQYWSVVHIALGLPFFIISLGAVALATVWALGDYVAELRRLAGASKPAGSL
ncbi:MAG: CDP-alcohol phosphatidyltransferase family protein [Myxococcales bacterium]|nr:CDP-alcohol phosphatidyltransferase family protein [Myxococcales bacterium]